MRFCLFCGKKPEEKNNEHVIPRWLIEKTGDPKRLLKLGPFVGETQRFMEFAFDQFRFPACRICNDAYASLESASSSVMTKLLALEAVSACEFDTLLDWFDKVRIGLWLGYLYLDKNAWQILPDFYIGDRITASDRALLIFRINNSKIGLHFIGTNTPAFAHMPSCFTLFVNNLVFMNVSTDFLLSRRAGLPHPPSTSLTRDGIEAAAPFRHGTERIQYPIMGYSYDRHCTVIAQPIFEKFLEIMPEA